MLEPPAQLSSFLLRQSFVRRKKLWLLPISCMQSSLQNDPQQLRVISSVSSTSLWCSGPGHSRALLGHREGRQQKPVCGDDKEN